jgi:hypothetical protein
MQGNPYENRYGTPERPVPEPSEPLDEDTRQEEASAGERRDEHDGPGPVYSAERSDDADDADNGTRADVQDGPVPVDRHGSENADSREAVESADDRDDVLSPGLVRDDGAVPAPQDRDADVLVAAAATTEPGTRGDLEPVDDVDYEQSWHEIKAQFVDDPRGSVEQADALVEAAVTEFTVRRQSLLDQWKNSDQADTEALRLALREYHTLLAQLTGK